MIDVVFDFGSVVERLCFDFFVLIIVVKWSWSSFVLWWCFFCENEGLLDFCDRDLVDIGLRCDEIGYILLDCVVDRIRICVMDFWSWGGV